MLGKSSGHTLTVGLYFGWKFDVFGRDFRSHWHRSRNKKVSWEATKNFIKILTSFRWTPTNQHLSFKVSALSSFFLNWDLSLYYPLLQSEKNAANRRKCKKCKKNCSKVGRDFLIWVFGSLVIVIKTGIRWNIQDFEYLSKKWFWLLSY